ncbi:MAG: hypothetical protein IPI00_15590 [Flavobacteriales bacterium]|nr:hypothetical protein [Flavobacteriales bacterium]MBK9535013.1 hypothetical protein [Flavobacteriales bacterium]MBP9138416.1 hypothetical protein [Flavobacteriales bacterium]HQX31279.1 hypothetical protein [Flavobacteriales bacterium]HQX39736.1 hypothetical protein [Flavobacteriales bacterium]
MQLQKMVMHVQRSAAHMQHVRMHVLHSSLRAQDGVLRTQQILHSSRFTTCTTLSRSVTLFGIVH